jgi:hypothetical protein
LIEFPLPVDSPESYRRRLGKNPARGNCGYPVVLKLAQIEFPGTWLQLRAVVVPGDFCVQFSLMSRLNRYTVTAIYTCDSSMQFFNWLNTAIDRGVIKQIFDHIRNYMICAFILAVGTTELRQPENQFFDLIPSGQAGLGVISIAILLILVNLYDGIRRISRSKYHVSFIAALVLIYFFLSIRVVEMAWDFRDLGHGSTF